MNEQQSTNSFRAIHDSEIEDFTSIVRENGCDPGDFQIEEIVDDPRPASFQGLVLTTATAIVKHKKTGASRQYRAGDDGTSWVVEFGQDLIAGRFR